jgi:preprotein translocase subunit SecF
MANGIINFRSTQPVQTQTVKQAVEATGTGVQEVRELGEVTGGGGFDYQVVASGMADKVFAALNKGLEKPDFEQRRVDYVGPQVGKQLRNRGIMALVYAMVAILIYVAFRFDFKFGPGALLAMLHDVVMVCGYYLVSRREFNLTSIAALLTIIGYSVNDTIVIYDRIREDMVKYKGKPLAEVINIAVNDTLGRTILTSGVTAMSLLGLLIFGVGEIWDFAMAMMVGIIVGTYSSVYIASPLTIWLDERAAAREANKGGMKPKMA